MDGGKVMALAVIFLAYFITGLAMSADEVTLQYGQFFDAKKVSGHGIANVDISVQDSEIGIYLEDSMVGDGDFKIDQVHACSQKAENLKRKVNFINNTNDSNLNLFESIRLTYSGSTPLVGENLISSGAGKIAENFKVNKMDRDHMAFFTSATNALLGNKSVSMMGIDTKNDFNGTWGTDAIRHKKLSKDIKSRAMLKGCFGVEKMIMFSRTSA
jgi:hypothetical protein